tara:strand:- start:1970 stop:2149 length:180 start_codon:yes stop_codon:yes gene_type:complete
LLGLKENVIIGRLIPAGTGMREFENLLVKTPIDKELPLEEDLDGKSQDKAEISENIIEI